MPSVTTANIAPAMVGQRSTTPDNRPRIPRKTSLGYILSPFSPDPSFASPPSSSSSNSRPSSSSKPIATLMSLPRTIISEIAYDLVVSTPNLHPATLLPLLSTSKTLHAILSFSTNPSLYNKLYAATFDTVPLVRRYAWISAALEKQSGGKRKAFDLFGDPKSWAEDYRLRWNTRRRMREVVKNGSLGGAVGTGAMRNQDLMPDLWAVWFLATEDDGRNTKFLTEECQYSEWLTQYYGARLLAESLEPGLPKDSPDKALSLWSAHLSGTNLEEASDLSLDEKIFMLRPFVFCSAEYDISFGPWNYRRLPLCPPGCTCETHVAEQGPPKAIPYNRFGYSWRRSPPHFTAGAILLFLRYVEKQSKVINKDDTPGMFDIAYTTPSILHDREWQRNSVCQDPHVSAGLPPLTFLGTLQGGWRGQFLFYSFEQYKEVLAGNMRAIYAGNFGAQPVDFDIKETVVKVKIGEEGGREGGMLSAGYDDITEEESGDWTVSGDSKEQRRILGGYGNQVLTGKEIEEDDEDGWTKEILLSGRAKSNWGWARVRGRVRAWDGLVIIELTYKQNPGHPLGRYLVRGYIHTGENLIGRWRDTFTPAHLQGHEGSFAMVRAADACKIEGDTSINGDVPDVVLS